MHPNPIPTPGLTAVTTTARALHAAGWRYDATSPMADDTTIRTLIHPSGREIHARTADGGEITALTMTGLTLAQAAGAVTGAGLAPGATPTPNLLAAVSEVIEAYGLDWESGVDVELAQGRAHAALIAAYEAATGGTADDASPAEPTVRERLAAELRKFADAIATTDLPLPTWQMRLGAVLKSRADLERWAAHLGESVVVNSNCIPVAEAVIPLDGMPHGPELVVALQSPQEQTELEAARARVAELEARLATGGTQ
ncbi:hypothetical protein ACH4T9_31380 [Micromonospora sp. NPDC020750]|uniref:hypothetical protein n=1 Tax=unclassified Micromonospora TaxID=2617518 RepID=UPI0037B82D68